MSGIFTPGMPTYVGPFSGNEVIPIDTNLPSGANPESAGVPMTALTAGVSNATNFRNLIDGGDFGINPFQRGTLTSTIAATPTYTADRWNVVAGAASNLTAQQIPMTPGTAGAPGMFNASLSINRPTANAVVLPVVVSQLMETVDTYRLRGQQVTLSFWALANAAFSSVGSALNVGLAIGTGTNEGIGTLTTLFLGGVTGGGTAWTGFLPIAPTSAQLRSGQVVINPQTTWVTGTPFVNAVTQPISTLWTRYQVTFTVPLTATELGVYFGYTPVGTTATTTDGFQLAGVQLEIGPYASPFEELPLSLTLARAYRYFWKITEPAASVAVAGGGVAYTTSNGNIGIPLPVTMRGNPAVTFAGTAVGATTWAVINNSATPTVLATPFLTQSALGANTPNLVTLKATTSAAFGAAGQAFHLVGAGGGSIIQISAEL
jgi:hypothetical protein